MTAELSASAEWTSSTSKRILKIGQYKVYENINAIKKLITPQLYLLLQTIIRKRCKVNKYLLNFKLLI